MTVKDIAKLGRMLAQFLVQFAGCFSRCEGRTLLSAYVRGLLSDVPRKNVEAIALNQDVAVRTLQRFLESIAWNENMLVDQCQTVVAAEHATAEAIGSIDETGITKSGTETAGVKRQYNGNRGKVENCVTGVALSYSTPGLSCLLDVRLYLPEEWANDPQRRKKNYIPDDVLFLTKPQIALQMVDRAKSNGIRVMAWNADELYGRDGGFLDGLDQRDEAFVVEIPSNAHAWLTQPKTLKTPAKMPNRRPKVLRKRDRRPSQVRNLARYSPALRDQTPQRYRIKDAHKGSQVWTIRWHTCWRKTHTDTLVSTQCTLIIAKNVLTGEKKYFLGNRVPGRDGWSLRKMLRVAFGRWPIEDCFREAKEELGLDHFECRGWRCIHRHFSVVILSHLFCARARQELSLSEDVLSGQLLTTEQVRRAMNVLLQSLDLPPRYQQARYQRGKENQEYYARRNAQSARSHSKTRLKRLHAIGIDPDKVKSVILKPPAP